MLWVLIRTIRQGDSNECLQHAEAILLSTHNTFLWRNDKNYPSIIIKYPPYLFQCFMTTSTGHFKELYREGS